MPDDLADADSRLFSKVCKMRLVGENLTVFGTKSVEDRNVRKRVSTQ
jgi:hypothetical protein